MVSIVIVNWNGAKDTLECIKSISKIRYSNYHILIVDNGSSPEEVSTLHERLDAISKIVGLRKNLGFAIANNIGIRISIQRGAEYVLLLNNDTVVEEKFLDELISAAINDPTGGIFGPKMYLQDDRKRLWYAGGKLNMYFRHKTEGLSKIDSIQYNSIKETDYVAGACMLIRKSVLDAIGLLPREYFLGWEDIDFCFAARARGFKCIYVPSAVIWHKASASYRRQKLSYRQVFFGFRNRIIMRYKYLSRTKFCLFFLVQILLLIPVHLSYYLLVYKDTERVRQMFRGIKAGLKDMKYRRILYSLPS